MLRRPASRPRSRIPYLLAIALVAASSLWVYACTVVPVRANREAASWQAARCTVETAEIDSVESDSGTSYKIGFRYCVEVGGRVYRGHRLDFVDDVSDESRAKLDARYPDAGAVVDCWYDPADPSRSVIERRGFPGAIGLFPLGGMPFAIALVVAGRGSVRRRVLPTGRLLVSTRNGSAALVWISAAAAWTTTTFALAAFQLGIVAVIFSIPVALAAIAWFGFSVLLYLTRVEVSVARETLYPGDRIDAKIVVAGPVKAISVDGKLVGREQTAWRDGSSARIDLRELHASPLDGAKVPASAMPSIEHGPSRLEWALAITASLPRWPDVVLEVPIVVGGRATRERTLDDPRATPDGTAPLALALDGDRTRYQPGEPIAGTIAWTREAPPRRASIRLAWESTSTHDVVHREVVGEVAVEELPRITMPDTADPYRGAAPGEDTAGPLAAVEQRRLRFVAPAAPFTYSGPLFEIAWHLDVELETTAGVERVHLELVIDPRG